MRRLHLNNEEKHRQQAMQSQGCTVIHCDSETCPFTKDGYCVSPIYTELCVWDKKFSKKLNRINNPKIPETKKESLRFELVKEYSPAFYLEKNNYGNNNIRQ